MNPVFYSSISKVAKKMIALFGKPITVGRAFYTQDPVTGATSGATSAQQTLQALLVKPTGSKFSVHFENSNLDFKSLIKVGAKGLVISAEGETFKPLVNDIVVFGGSNWMIKGLVEVNPDGTSLLYKALVVKTDVGLSNIIVPPPTGPTDPDVWTEIGEIQDDIAALQANDTKDRFVHTQSTPATVWTVNHNLGRFVDTTVFSVGGAEVEAEIVNVSNNQIQVLFSSPFSGTAVCD